MMCHSYSDIIAFGFKFYRFKKVNEKGFHCLESAQILLYIANLLFVKMKLILQSPISPFAKKASHLLQLLGGGFVFRLDLADLCHMVGPSPIKKIGEELSLTYV